MTQSCEITDIDSRATQVARILEDLTPDLANLAIGASPDASERLRVAIGRVGAAGATINHTLGAEYGSD